MHIDFIIKEKFPSKIATEKKTNSSWRFAKENFIQKRKWWISSQKSQWNHTSTNCDTIIWLNREHFIPFHWRFVYTSNLSFGCFAKCALMFENGSYIIRPKMACLKCAMKCEHKNLIKCKDMNLIERANAIRHKIIRQFFQINAISRCW